MPENPMGFSPPTTAAATSTSTSNNNVFASMFAPNSQPSKIPPPSLSLSSPLYLSNNASSIFTGPAEHDHCHYAPSPQPAMSATALLQKAAQMGAAASNPSLLRGIGLAVSSSTPSAVCQDPNVKTECNSLTPNLGLGLPSNGSSGFTNPMIGSSSLFGNKPTTLDLLGLGMGDGGASSSGLSALLTSFGGGPFNVGVGATTTTTSYGEAAAAAADQRKHNGPAAML